MTDSQFPPGCDESARVALVVGASRGIGTTVAWSLAQQHCQVVLAARNTDALQAVTDKIVADGHSAIWQRTDVTDEDSVAGAVEATVRAFGRLDIAVNLANQTKPPAPLAETDTEGFDQGMATSVRGTFLAMKYQIPAMIQSGGGVITNIVSVAGVTAIPGLSTYVAGKAAIIALTKVAALDYATKGIRVNAIAPGPINTYRVNSPSADGPGRGIVATVPMQRIGQPEEVANTVLWLSSPAAAFVTGTVIPVDGGQLAGGIIPPRPARTEQASV